MNDEKLNLSIKTREDLEREPSKSADYEIKLGNYVLGRGVTCINIDMPADKKPIITITCVADKVDIELLDVVSKYALKNQK